MHARVPFAVLAALLVAGASLAAGGSDRRFTFTYRTEIGPVPAGVGPVHVFLPLPRVSEQQEVESLEIDTSLAGRIETESVYGNRYWHGTAAVSDGKPIVVEVRADVQRRLLATRVPPTGGAPLSDAERREWALFLGPNARVAVGDPILDPILAEVHARAADESPAAMARAIYDWVVANVEYKKVGQGWGNGDTFWACSERYGNCTDFHALFISLARTEGIPARFEIGFPVPEDARGGEIAGYHCWVAFLLPGLGWVPIDASEASKHPEKRERLYGTQPADRIHFSTGRDLRLGPDHASAPLNYFIDPLVEVGGERWEGPVERRLHFEEKALAADVRRGG